MKYFSQCHQNFDLCAVLLSVNSMDGHHGNKYYWFGIAFLW